MAVLTDEEIQKITEVHRLHREAWMLLNLVVAEWLSDPTSVACFDLRIVERAKQAIARRKEIDKTDFLSPMLS